MKPNTPTARPPTKDWHGPHVIHKAAMHKAPQHPVTFGEATTKTATAHVGSW
jgi:hypothetical protein